MKSKFEDVVNHLSTQRDEFQAKVAQMENEQNLEKQNMEQEKAALQRKINSLTSKLDRKDDEIEVSLYNILCCFLLNFYDSKKQTQTYV